jgi:AraC family L-rhamnose operon transcriptional activator RhaR/AraC family L-rhamnose operon regulatory protein RhaS
MKRMTESRYFPIPGFPLACWLDEHHGEMEVHTHDFHELVIILRGYGRHVTVGRGYDVEAGDVFLICGDMAHGYTQTKHMSLANILFNPQRLHLPLADLHDVPGYHALFQVEPRMRRSGRFLNQLHLAPDALTEAAALIARLRQEIDRREPGYRFAARTHLMSLIGFLSRIYFETANVEPRPLKRMSELLSFINDRFREPIDIGRLTHMAGMSRSTLTRAFHAVMGCSPIEHVIRVRIAHAAELLRQPGVRITDVAFESGFTDSNYFTRQFKKVMGVSPSEYRRRHADRSTGRRKSGMKETRYGNRT